MLHVPSDPEVQSGPASDRRRLDSWKAIARYLDRDVTTVRRWEKGEGLPVHRHLHRKLGSVYGYSDEIDAWWKRRSTELSAPEPESVPRLLPNSHNSKARVPLRAVLLTVVSLALGLTSHHSWTPHRDLGNPPIARIAVAPPEGTLVDSLALSPDGREVVFAATKDGASRLWIRGLDSLVSQPLEGTEGAAFPFWSPDGASLGFFAAGRLKRIEVATRAVVDLAVAPDGYGGTWNDRGDIVFSSHIGAGLFRVMATGGPVTPATTVGRGTAVEGHAWPEFLPDGRHLIYTDYATDSNRYGIHVLDLESGRTSRVQPAYSSAIYVAGHLLYEQKEGMLVARRLDPATWRVFGEPRVVADRVFSRYGLGHKIEVSASRSGLVAVRSVDDVKNQLALVDRTGTIIRTFGPPGFHSNPTLSPDGRRFVASIWEESALKYNLWRFEIDGTDSSRLSVGPVSDLVPVWSPDGRRLIFRSIRDKRATLYERDVAGGVEKVVLAANTTPTLQMPETWSADGRYLTVQTIQQGTRFDVLAWDLAGAPRAFPVLATEANEGQSQLSPDGRFIAYVSDESGRFEVYVKPFPAGQGKWIVSSRGGYEPRWGPNGGLFYIAADRLLTEVSVTTAPAFRIGRATALFHTQAEYLWQDTRNHYDVMPDGRSFVMLRPAAERRAAAFTLIVNWR